MSSKIKTYLMNCALAFQHLFAVLGGVIVVPMILNTSTTMGLFASGFGTVMFYLVTKRQIPVFHGSSFTYMSALTSFKDYCKKRGLLGEKYVAAQAPAIIFSGILYGLFAIIAYYVGPKRLSQLFPPIVVGPIVITIGLSLCPSVISSNIVQEYSTGKHKGYEVWVVVCITCLVIILFTCFAPGIWNVFGIIFGIVAGYIASAAFQVINYKTITDAKWIIFQPSAFMEDFGFWKYIKWDWNAVVMIAPLTLVALMEHLGDVTTNGAVCGKDFFVEPGLHRTLLGDGVALAAAGFVGAPPMSTYAQNTGVLVITRNYNPDVLAIAGCYAMALGLINKIGGVFASIPNFVIGAASMMMFGIIACMGVKVLIMNNIEMSKSRNLIICAVIIIIGIGFDAGGVEIKAGDVEISPLAVATLFGIFMNLVIPQKLKGVDNSDDEENSVEEKEKNAGNENYEAGYSHSNDEDSSSSSSSSRSSTSTGNNVVKDVEA